jgi:predicted anti-sigma-YlaC factor YlaD
MTCRKVRKLIPLAAGGDLRRRPARAVRAHLDACAGCRAELEDLRMALAGFKAAARAASVPDWSEGEWKTLMARATAPGRTSAEAAGPAGRGMLRPRWAAASVMGALIGLAVLSVLFRGPSPRPGRATAADRRGQDVLTMTMVSPDTGLQIVWILDKNFDWKGDRQ